MKDRSPSRWGRAIAVLAVVALGLMTVAPAFSTHSNKHVRKMARKIARKVSRNVVNNQVPGMIGDVINLFGSSFVRVTATAGADVATARAAAPKVPLLSKGPLSVYGKCFRDDSGPTVYGAAFIETTAAGSVFDTDEDDLMGGGTAAEFLNPGTLETDRELLLESASSPGANFEGHGEDWHAMAPGGTSLNGELSVGVKAGDLAEGNGVYGAGDVCLFGGFGVGN